jgi:hypothetical protein
MRLPFIDFDAHPAYRGLEPATAGRDYSRAERKRELVHARQTWGSLEKVWDYPNSKPPRGAPETYRSLVEDGVVGLRLNDATVTMLRSLSEAYFAQIRSRGAVSTPRRLSDSQIRFSYDDLRSNPDPKLAATILEIMTQAGIGTLTGKYLGASQIYLSYIHFKITDNLQPIIGGSMNVFQDVSIPDPPTVYMHIDTTPFHLKAIIYLSDVLSERDGPFKYILGSNQALREQFADYLERLATQHFVSSRDENGRRRLMSLPPEKRQRLDFGSDLLSKDDFCQGLLDLESTFLSSESNVILFDPRGFHRGARVVEGEREVLQLSISGVIPGSGILEMHR